jgi:hypothetical protein
MFFLENLQFTQAQNQLAHRKYLSISQKLDIDTSAK